MSHEDAKELYRHHREFQNKYAYFLLAIAASGIAFAVQKSEGALLQWPLAPLALSVLSFGLSFYKGMRHLEWIGATLGASYALVQLMNGSQPPSGEPLEEAIRRTKSDIDSIIKDAKSAMTWQLRFLFSGGVLFVVWHGLDIYLRTEGL